MTNADTLINVPLAAKSMYAIDNMKSTSILFVPVLLKSAGEEDGLLRSGEDKIVSRFLNILASWVIMVVIMSKENKEHASTAIAVCLMSSEL